MMGTALSRWTMVFFAVGLVFLLIAETLMAAGFGYPAVAVEDARTLLLVHSVTVGWLSLLLCGALFQFVPVLVAKPLCHPQLALPALLLLVAGAVSLLCGFLHLAGIVETEFQPLALAGPLLSAGFALTIWSLGRTLWSGRPLPLPARFVAVGFAGIVATAAVGTFFTLLLTGIASPEVAVDWRAEGLPVHISAGLGGWLTLTAVGVSYRLLPMFMLAPDGERATGRAALWAGGAALSLLVVAAPLERLWAGPGFATAAACLLGLAAAVCYGIDLAFFYRNRKRRTIELNSKSALGAFVSLYLSILLAIVLWAAGMPEGSMPALLYLAAFGWLTGLGLSQLYKIVPFLTWLECYGPIMGRKPTPRVQDLVVEKRDTPWFALYFAAVLAGTGALLWGAPVLFRVAAAAMLLATLAIIVELVLARRLFNVAAARRLPEGTMRPRLFLPAPR